MKVPRWRTARTHLGRLVDAPSVLINHFGAVARVRHSLSQAIHRFFHERGFLWVHTPIITGSDCEGAGYAPKRQSPGGCGARGRLAT